MQDIITFNEVMSNLGLQEIPLEGRNFTWSNMQQEQSSLIGASPQLIGLQTSQIPLCFLWLKLLQIMCHV
jgi:hypothetical protein